MRRALLATMPECTEGLSELYYFVADRLDATLAAADAAKMASLENSIREDEKKIAEARREIRGYKLQIRHKTLEIAVNKAAIIALTPLMVIIAAGTVARRVGWDRWVDLENKWFSFGRFWFLFVFFCFVVAHGIVRGIVLRERKEAE